ncbi:LysM peptidoglycan-binding domain-containing protein [Motiliproteus sp. SC1-56]|uniref:LysM peptidoglycan-binding domain-containing protein n=1 Tax=Motiliproteus sp. SC1-56 TaxID=2799565 RepID=UPI001A8DB95A|nr:LysM peptidoglycan-binding domain-containing protein [Motiliproteus sp. SC1-56]
MRKLLIGFAVLLLVGWGPARADVINLADDYPDQYVVVKGDTLWDISARFLESPWLWPKVWTVNPQIDNPHLIYPGDIVYLVFVNGKPELRLKRGDRKLSPEIRTSSLEQAIPAIPLQDIKSFLSDNLVLSENLLDKAPYVIGGVNESIIAGAGDRVYARGDLPDDEQNYFGVYRPARTYTDPDTGEVLGYESQSIGGGYLVNTKDDILTLELKRTSEEVRVLDRVLPTQEQVVQSVFYPSAPATELSGKILSVLRGVAKIGQFDVVAINLGQREGLEPGHVFHVYKQGEIIKDPVTGEMLTLPKERGGVVMVFNVFEKVSYALVMEAQNTLSVLDEVRSAR